MCLKPCDSVCNAVAKRSVLYVFINLLCAESVCFNYRLRVYGSKYIITMGVRRGAKRAFTPLEDGSKKQKFLENFKSTF